MTLRIVRTNPKGRTALIYIDDQCVGTLPIRVLPPFCAPENSCQINSDQAAQIMELLSSYARKLLLDYLAKAEHSQWQSRQLLLRRRFDEAIIDQQINYAIQHSFIDDARYSEIYIRSWINRGIGKRLLISKLYEQRIDPTIWKPLLEVMYKEEDGSHKLEEQMQSYIARQKEMPAQKLKEKVFGYFIRKGYDLDEVMRAWLATQAGNIGQ